MKIRRIDKDFSVCKMQSLDAKILENEFCFLGKTDEEISLVCETDIIPENCVEREDGWKLFRIEGILDFSLIGILASIAGLLAENGISIFAVSTFNTDYILVKKENYNRAMNLLADNNYDII